MGNGIEARGYVQAQAGRINTSDSGNFANHGVTAVTELRNQSGTYLRTDLTAGTALGGKLEVGHSFDIGENMGLDLSAKAQYNKSLTSTNSIVFHDTALIQDGESYQVQIEHDYQNSWKPSSLNFGASAKLSKTFDIAKNFKMKLTGGIEGGIQKSNRPDCNITSTMTYVNNTTGAVFEKSSNFDMAGSKAKGYGTWVLGAEAGSDKIKVVANATNRERTVGVQFTLGKTK